MARPGGIRSEDASGGWTRQEHSDGLILTAPETADGGPVVGRHADVVPLQAAADGKERALIVYFTHPHWNGEDIDGMTADPRATSATFGRQSWKFTTATWSVLTPDGTTKGRTAEL
ncbi:hydrolase, hydrolyzing O-glycosyl compounds [Arthrobacter sp. Hiyo4]|nr:hydrolase, hydrolyzing O-glycosyl compounds [Arthrobacter sp. Hiyo4]